jgi:hypothetical protein
VPWFRQRTNPRLSSCVCRAATASIIHLGNEEEAPSSFKAAPACNKSVLRSQRGNDVDRRLLAPRLTATTQRPRSRCHPSGVSMVMTQSTAHSLPQGRRRKGPATRTTHIFMAPPAKLHCRAGIGGGGRNRGWRQGRPTVVTSNSHQRESPSIAIW